MFKIARFMGHSKPSTAESVYAHLLEDDHSDAMTALGAMEVQPDYGNALGLKHVWAEVFLCGKSEAEQ